MHAVRLEINLDVIKNDIEAETVRKVVENILRAGLAKGGYIELQTVLLNQPKPPKKTLTEELGLNEVFDRK